MKPAVGNKPSFTTFVLPNAYKAFPTAINAGGVVTGYSVDANNLSHGFRREPNGAIVIFDAPGAGANAGEGTTPTSINESGHIAGYFFGVTGGHGLVRHPNGAFTIFDVSGARATMATTIHASGHIAGFYYAQDGSGHGFLRDVAGAITTFDVPNASNTFPMAINGRVEIVGTYSKAADSTHSHGFLRQANGSITTFDVPNSSDTYVERPEAVNASGQITGYYYLMCPPRRLPGL